MDTEHRRKVNMETVLHEFNLHTEEDVAAIKEIKDEIAKVKEIHYKDFESLETFHTDTYARLKRLEIAIYGDNDDEKDLGMKKQNDEMYKILTTTKAVGGVLGYSKTIALWIIAVAGAWAISKGFFK